MSELVKVRLLADGGFSGMCGVSLPVDVMAKVIYFGKAATVPNGEMERIGYDMKQFKGRSTGRTFEIGTECEIIND